MHMLHFSWYEGAGVDRNNLDPNGCVAGSLQREDFNMTSMTGFMAELRMEDVHSFFNFLRMQPEMFDELLNRVAQRIQKNDTLCRKSLEPGLKLAITLRHLAAGDKYPTLHFGFLVARREKEGDLTKSYDKTPIPTENSKTKGQHTNATKNFDYTTIADRLRTVSWSNK